MKVITTYNKVIIRWLFSVCLVMCYAGSALGQSAVEDFRKIDARLADRKFSMVMKYALYETYTSARSIEEKNYRVTAWENEMSLKVEGLDMIQTGKLSLHADHERKTLILYPVDGKETRKQISEITRWINVDSLFKRYSKVELLASSKDSRTYRLHLPKGTGNYAYVDTRINTQTFLLEKVIVYFSQDMDRLLGNRFSKQQEQQQLPRLEITFTQYSFPSKRDDAAFSMSGYFTVSGKGAKTLTSEYRSYEFTDYTVKKRKK
jgi:hypothetical protein